MAVDTSATTTDTGSGGWETPPTEPLGTSTPCPQIGKRHRWKGGTVCIRCGASKETAASEPKTSSNSSTVPGSTRVGAFETLAATLWLGFGAGIEYQPFVLGQNVKREDGTEIEGRAVKVPVGRSIQMEAAIAGKRLDKAFHKANPIIYSLAAAWFKKTSWATELAPLFIPPLVVGIMATQPAIASKFKSQLTMALLPVLIEQAKVAQQQAKLMANLEDVNQETLDMAGEMLKDLLGSND